MILWLVACIDAWAAEDVLERAQSLQDADPAAAIVLLNMHIPADRAFDTQGKNLEAASRLLYLRGQIQRNQGNLKAAADDAVRLQQIAATLDQDVISADALYLHGTVLAEDGDIAGALERFHAAREILEQTRESTDARVSRARILNALGVANNFIPDYERARKYYQQALPLARELDDQAMETSILGNLALVISELEGPEAGLVAHQEALSLALQRGDKTASAYQQANICSRQVEIGRLAAAEASCTDALARVEALGHPRIIAGTRMSLGDLRRAQGRLDEAHQQYLEALALADGRIVSVETSVLDKLATLSAARGQPVQALEYLQQLIERRETELQNERATQIEELEMRYSVEQQQREIEWLQRDAELKAIQLHQRNQMLAGTAVALVLVTALALLAWRAFRMKSKLEGELGARNRELENALRTITRLAREDPLTGLLNRRAFAELADLQQQRCRDQGMPLTIAMVDIDNFKALNDRYGHAAGDEVLQQLAALFSQALRSLDIVCRWGGEEFVFLLPGTDVQLAEQIAGRVSKEVKKTGFSTEAGVFSITLTFGIAPVYDDIDTALQAADQAMYSGKHGGRDRIATSRNWKRAS
ncbi:MAG: tetratricopeptide repeat-containing diguanylate cyclase [Wenzhouxiangellaceae bacterium]|nr:tetratricopeptide repeat-containing diguanylate cyclase [Wenzhouxiangellaceae bacterium]